MHTLSTPIIIFLHQPEGKAESVSQSMFINLPAGSRPYTGLFRIDMPSVAEGRVPGSENIKITASGKPLDSWEWLTQPTDKCMWSYFVTLAGYSKWWAVFHIGVWTNMPVWSQTIMWINAWLFLIGQMETNFSKMWIKIFIKKILKLAILSGLQGFNSYDIKIAIVLVGDPMENSMSNLGRLVRQPSGCGEQNMIGFVPNIYAVKYLDATNRNQPDLRNQAIRYMRSGKWCRNVTLYLSALNIGNPFDFQKVVTISIWNCFAWCHEAWVICHL